MLEKDVLAVDIGGTFIKYALVGADYKVKEKWKVKSGKFTSKEEFYDYVCSNMKYLDSVDSIGVSAPGIIDKESNVRSYVAPDVNVIYGTNINEEIKNRTNKKTATINDAKSAGLCEAKLGNAKGKESSAFLILGTGTGGCVCYKDNVVLGRDGSAGEFHKLPFFNYKENKIDCMGDYASMTGLINIYNEKVEDKVTYGTEVCDKYLNNDETAIKSVDEWISKIITQLLTITVFYNPDVICIGGGISEEDWFIDKLADEYKKACIKHMEVDVITTEITRCKYNNDSNLLGAVINLINNN